MTSSMFYGEECAIPMSKLRLGLTAATRSHGKYQITRQKPDHMAKTGSHGKNQVIRDKSGTKRDLQEPNGDPGYSVMVHIRKTF